MLRDLNQTDTTRLIYIDTRSMKTFISVIIPLYNKATCIEETVYSVLKQSYQDFELIIVNDGSTDNSLDIINKISDNRIRIINKVNEGVSATRNRGAHEAIGEYLLFLDADDYIYPDCLQQLHDLKAKYPEAGVYAGNFEIYFDIKNIQKGCRDNLEGYVENPFKLRWHKAWNMRLGSFIMKKNIFEKIGGFHPIMTIGEDVYFTDALLGQSRIAYTPAVIMRYNRENSDLSNKRYPIEKCLSAYVDLSCGDFYQKNINAECVVKGFIKKLYSKDLHGCLFLAKKNYKYIFTIMTAFVAKVFHI